MTAVSKSHRKLLSKDAVLFIIILVEGYVVLASELLSMRLLVSFVGSDTAIISIIVSAVLMPLAFGYYAGGRFYKHRFKNSTAVQLRQVLIRNMLLSAVFLSLGLSYFCIEVFIAVLISIGITSRFMLTTIYALFFLVVPVYLLGQTTPLVSNYFSKHNLSRTTGKMLFFSTFGSFFGATLTSLVLMHTLGVHHTATITILLLTILVMLLSRRVFSLPLAVMILVLAFTAYINSDYLFSKFGYVSNNAYSLIRIDDVEAEKQYHSRLMVVNNSSASKYTTDPEKQFSYIQYINERIIHHLPKDRVHDILVIGAGGFSIGEYDTLNRYTYVDIDADLKEVTEKYLRKYELEDNKVFVAQPARSFLFSNTKKYDVIVLDAYSNFMSVPYQLVTVEYFEQVKSALKLGGVMAANIFSDPKFRDDWSVKIHNTLYHAFGPMDRHTVINFSPWDQQSKPQCVIYVYYHNRQSDGIYTDNKNAYFFDKK